MAVYPTRTCSLCEAAFLLLPDHPGKATECRDCTSETTERVMGKVAWSGKHVCELEITSNRQEAMRFNAAQRRFGAGVIRSIVASKTPTDAYSRGEGFGQNQADNACDHPPAVNCQECLRISEENWVLTCERRGWNPDTGEPL